MNMISCTNCAARFESLVALKAHLCMLTPPIATVPCTRCEVGTVFPPAALEIDPICADCIADLARRDAYFADQASPDALREFARISDLHDLDIDITNPAYTDARDYHRANLDEATGRCPNCR